MLDSNFGQARNKQTMPEVMITSDGIQVCLMREKCKTFTEYYSKLYETSRPAESDFRCFMDGIDLLRLSEDQQQCLNAGITINDLETSLQQIKLDNPWVLII